MTTAADAYLNQVKDIVLRHLQGRDVTVYLFGSRAVGGAHRFSDVDVAIDPKSPLPTDVLATLQEALEESIVPWHVDVVDLSHVDPDFRQRSPSCASSTRSRTSGKRRKGS